MNKRKKIKKQKKEEECINNGNERGNKKIIQKEKTENSFNTKRKGEKTRKRKGRKKVKEKVMEDK